MEDPIVVIGNNGSLTVGRGYTIGQILKALEDARSAVLSVVLRPAVEESHDRSGADQ